MLTTATMQWRSASRTLIADNSKLPPKFRSKLPSTVQVKSHKTGRVVSFRLDQKKMIENEFYDGLETHYVTDEPVAAKYLVVLNEY